MRVYLALEGQKRMIEGYKKYSIQKGGNVYYENSLIFDEAIYDYDFADKVLNKEFNIYLEYTNNIREFNFFVKQYHDARLNDVEKKYEITRNASVAAIEKINTEKLSLIINKIGKSLGKERAKLEVEGEVVFRKVGIKKKYHDNPNHPTDI